MFCLLMHADPLARGILNTSVASYRTPPCRLHPTQPAATSSLPAACSKQHKQVSALCTCCTCSPAYWPLCYSPGYKKGHPLRVPPTRTLCTTCRIHASTCATFQNQVEACHPMKCATLESAWARMTKSAGALTPSSSNGVKPHRSLTTQAAREEHGDAPANRNVSVNGTSTTRQPVCTPASSINMKSLPPRKLTHPISPHLFYEPSTSA